MKTQKRRITTIKDLSNDSMVEILLLLPLSSIIQCFNVCKRWRSLITGCPLLLTKTVNVACVWHPPALHKYKCLEEGQRRLRSSELDINDFPMPRRLAYLDHLSCNGLLFSHYFSRRKAYLNECYISNPLTRECVRLPNPTMACHDSFYGLAFDNNPRIINSSCKDVASYKIVMAHRISPDKEKASYKFEIYSSVTRRWKLLKRASKPHGFCWSQPDQRAVYCNRVLYWHCSSRKALMFNMETKTSGYLNLPSDNKIYMSKLTERDGQLHYIRKCFNSYRLNILKMLMTGEWLILHDVDLQGALEKCLDHFPMLREGIDNSDFQPIDMSCQRDDNVLLNDNYERVVSYDLKRDVSEIVLEKDFILPEMLFQYTPTNQRIVHEELQHRFRTERSKQFKQFYNYARNLLGCFN